MSDSNFKTAVATMIDRIEGTDLTDDPRDVGGRTRFGLSENFDGIDAGAITREEAERIYRNKYWDPLVTKTIGSDQTLFTELPWPAAFLAFDYAVWNGGAEHAARMIQIWLGNLKVDGRLGPKTLARAREINTLDFIDRVIELRMLRMDEVIQDNPSQEKFRLGWQNRIAKAAVYAAIDPVKSQSIFNSLSLATCPL